MQRICAAPKNAMPQISRRKLSQIATKFVNIFSLESFLLYWACPSGTRQILNITCLCRIVLTSMTLWECWRAKLPWEAVWRLQSRKQKPLNWRYFHFFEPQNFYSITLLTVDMYKKWSTLMVCQANHHNTHTSFVPRPHPAFCHFHSASDEKLGVAWEWG